MDTPLDLDAQLQERLTKLPKVVQEAITSSEIEKHLRKIADTHKLHLDQWQVLENEVMLALLGFLPVEELEDDIRKKIGVTPEIARELATKINQIVFEPIRQELERQLEHPTAKEVVLTGVEAARSQALSGSGNAPAASQPTSPAPTPPASAPETTAARAPASGAYKPGEASSVRKEVIDDPY